MDFYETGFGWISNFGDVLACKSFGHIEAISEWKVVQDNLPEVDEILARVQDAHNGCLEMAERDGDHSAEWHTYEMARDSAESELIDVLTKAGYIRLGVNRYTQTVEAQGRPEAIASRLHILRRIVQEYNAENRCEFTLRIHSEKNVTSGGMKIDEWRRELGKEGGIRVPSEAKLAWQDSIAAATDVALLATIAKITKKAALHKRSQDPNWAVRAAVAANPHAEAFTLSFLARDVTKVKRAVAANPNTDQVALDDLSMDADVEVREAVACNPHTPSSALVYLAEHDKAPSVLAKLAVNPELAVRLGIVENKRTPEDILDILAKDEYSDVCDAVAERRSRARKHKI